MCPSSSFKFPLWNTGNQQSGQTEKILTLSSTNATLKSASPKRELSIQTSFNTAIKLLLFAISSHKSWLFSQLISKSLFATRFLKKSVKALNRLTSISV